MNSLSYFKLNDTVEKLRAEVRTLGSLNPYLSDRHNSDNPKFDTGTEDKTFSQRFINRKNLPLYYGQRKLAITEIFFFINYVHKLSLERGVKIDKPRTDPGNPEEMLGYNVIPSPVTILYVGAAPGKHIPFLYNLFPQYFYILYDPGTLIRTVTPKGIVEYVEGFDHKLISLAEKFNNIILKQQFFTEEEYDFVRENTQRNSEGNGLLIFMSDIRTIPSKDEIKGVDKDRKKFLLDKELINNQELQKSWVLALNPDISMLKFKLPKSVLKSRTMSGEQDEELSRMAEELSKDYPNIFTDDGGYSYLDGRILIQPYLKSMSEETRLIVTGDSRSSGSNLDKLKTYNIKDYEEKMFYHNVVERFQPFDVQPYKSMSGIISYDYCYEILTLDEYSKVANSIPSLFENIHQPRSGRQQGGIGNINPESLSIRLTKILGDETQVRFIKNRYRYLDDEYISEISDIEHSSSRFDIVQHSPKLSYGMTVGMTDKLSFLDDL